MSSPTLPPYLASWEELRKALFHSPFLDNQPSQPRPAGSHGSRTDRVAITAPSPSPLPGPDNWRNAAVAYVVELIHIKELAHAIDNPRVSQQLGDSAKRALDQFFEHVCATGPRGASRSSLTGPPPWAWLLSVELMDVANSRSGRPRKALMQAAAQLADKASGGVARTAPRLAC